jgi:death-on-curing protein
LPNFITDIAAVELAHAIALEQWGGLTGMRDEAAIEAALHRAIHKASYGGADVDLFDLAAAYAFGLAAAHGYADGNKRTAWMVCVAFLDLNGYAVTGPAIEKFQAVRELVQHQLSEEHFAKLFRGWASPLP